MRHSTVIPVLVLLTLAAGCDQAKLVKVTYKSDPPGGILYRQSGELWGSCPKVLWYNLDDEAIRKGYLDAKGLIVRWPTGHERRSDDLIRITIDGTDRRVIFTQPLTTATAGNAPRLWYRRD